MYGHTGWDSWGISFNTRVQGYRIVSRENMSSHLSIRISSQRKGPRWRKVRWSFESYIFLDSRDSVVYQSKNTINPPPSPHTVDENDVFHATSNTLKGILYRWIEFTSVSKCKKRFVELFRDKTRIQLLHKVFLVLSNFKINKMDIGKDLRLPFRVLQINRDLEKLRVKVSNRLF